MRLVPTLAQQVSSSGNVQSAVKFCWGLKHLGLCRPASFDVQSNPARSSDQHLFNMLLLANVLLCFMQLPHPVETDESVIIADYPSARIPLHC